MSKKQSPAIKEALTRVRMIFSEVEKYIKRLPPYARLTIGDMAEDFSNRFGLRVNDVKPLISFYIHVKYDIGENDVMLRRGRTGGLQKITRNSNGN